MATKSEILQALAAESGPITTSALAEKMGVELNQLTTPVSRMVKAGEILKNEASEISISEKGREEVTLPSEVEVGATDFDHFKYLGKKIGVIGDLIDVTANHVWAGGDYRDLTWVWNALAEMGIRQDLMKRWWNSWRSFLHQGIPPELKDVVAASTKAIVKEGDSPLKKPERDYIIVDDESVRVGEGLGDYTMQDAKDLLAIKALRDRFRGSSGTERRPDAAQGEKVSELLIALQPYLTKDTDPSMLKEMLADKMQNLKTEILASMPQSSGQPKSWIDQLSDVAVAMGKLKEIGPTLRSFLGLPEGGGNPHPPANPVSLPFTDKDGNPMTITADPEVGIQWLRFLGEERRADDKQGMLKAAVQTFREEWPTLAGALKETAEGYNRVAQGKRGSQAASTEEAGLLEATCPSCQRSFPLKETPTGVVSCPHCDAVLTAVE